eukprot:CAMPEP_0177582652 /NCGR_PEP_ID=MMETSP0419_2-20121207/2875_1 /TAXON_ID=582737 /ORGANISM="Tetraselmis sp., Strain GSL018" /LENGTH=223 /DNA_ID=CAMNT_0019071935 /DNA_START=180 /DNA_END=848 /DNA_ORIENTATION=-
MAEGNNKFLLNNLCCVGKVHGVGGGRGIFAASEIRSGTKVITEEPVLEVPVSAGVESDLHSALVRKMLLELGPEERNQALEVCSSLHPVALSDCRAADVEALHVRLLPTIERLKNEGNHGLSSEALLRLMLAMQFNAFYSGLYPTLALINHSCRPNCIKLAPRGGKGAQGPRRGEAKRPRFLTSRRGRGPPSRRGAPAAAAVTGPRPPLCRSAPSEATGPDPW